MRNGEGAIVQWNVICLYIDGGVRAHRASGGTCPDRPPARGLLELGAGLADMIRLQRSGARSSDARRAPACRCHGPAEKFLPLPPSTITLSSSSSTARRKAASSA